MSVIRKCKKVHLVKHLDFEPWDLTLSLQKMRLSMNQYENAKSKDFIPKGPDIFNSVSNPIALMKTERIYFALLY